MNLITSVQFYMSKRVACLWSILAHLQYNTGDTLSVVLHVLRQTSEERVPGDFVSTQYGDVVSAFAPKASHEMKALVKRPS